MNAEKKRFIISASTPLIDALNALNETGKRIIVLEDGGLLKGVLTYGDISRWILKGKSLESPALDAATQTPYTVNCKDVSDAEVLFSEKKLNAIPVIDDERRIVDVLFEEDCKRSYEQIDVPIVIMAGGKGTRLYPYTKILPKPLIPIGEIPISEHIINRFVMNGCHIFYLIVNYKKNMIKAYYNEIEKHYILNFIDEDTPLGTGGGLSLIKSVIKTTFILTNCDSIIDEDYSKILEFHRSCGNSITMICSNQRYQVPYGVVKMDEFGNLVSMEEKPSYKYLTNTGSYIVEPEVIERVSPGEFVGFPEIIQRVKDEGKKVGIYTVDNKAWLDMGQFDAMDEMKRQLNIND